MWNTMHQNICVNIIRCLRFIIEFIKQLTEKYAQNIPFGTTQETTGKILYICMYSVVSHLAYVGKTIVRCLETSTPN